MAYYSALQAKWATLTGTSDEKLAAVNAATAPGPNKDVEIPTIVGSLMLSGAYLQFASFAQSAFTGVSAHDAALGAAKLLMACITVPNAPVFRMSDAATFAKVKAMMDAILAYEMANPGTTGFTQSVHDDLLALCETTVPWWQANGYTSPLNQNDLDAAGLS